MAAAIPLAAQVIASTIIGATGVGAVGASLIFASATLLGGYVANELFGSRDSAEQSKDELAIRGNYVSTEKTLPLIYGKRLVGSNDVFAEIGTKGEEPEDDEKYLWVVHCIGEGICEGIAQDDHGNDLIYIDNKLIHEFDSGLVTYWFYEGSDTQVNNPEIEAGAREDEPEKFTDAMRNTCYIVFRFKYSNSVFSGVPTREIVINGKKVLDVRDDVVKWSQNPALILYDYLTNSRYGLGWDPTLMYEPSWAEAATYCDSVGWEVDYVVGSPIKSQTIIDTILGHFRGALYWYNGLLYLRFMDLNGWEVPVFTVLDEHIARDSTGKAMVSINQPSRFNIPDGAMVGYINSRDNWATDRVSIGEAEGQIKNIEFSGFTRRDLALEMGTYALERQRLNRIYNFTLRPDTIVLDTNDLIYINSSELGIFDQMARVKNNALTSDGLVHVTAVLESFELYDTTYNPDTSRTYDVNFPSISDPPPSVENVRVVEEIYDYRGRSFVRLNVFFDQPDKYPWFSHVDVYVGFPTPPPDPQPPLAEDYLFRFPASDDFQIDPVEEGQTYYIRLNSVSTYGVKQDNDSAFIIAHRVIGISEDYPPCPAYLSATVNMTSIDLISNELPDPDIEGYELRLGPNWKDAVFVTFRSHPSFSFSSVKPGFYDFWLNTQHKNWTYCPDPVEATALIEEPPPGSYLFFEEVVLYASSVPGNVVAEGIYPDQTLRCAHIDENLVGEFVSNEIDTGNEDENEKMLVYVLFDFWMAGGSTTWNDLAPSGTDWYNFAYDGEEAKWKTWYELLGDETRTKAAQIEVGLDYSTTPGGPYESVDRLELLTAIVTGRYVRIRYKITDVNISSFLTLGASTFKAAYLENNLLIDA